MSPCRQVFDAITLVDYVHSSTADNPHFGVKFQTTVRKPRVNYARYTSQTTWNFRFGRDSVRNSERNSVPETPSTP